MLKHRVEQVEKLMKRLQEDLHRERYQRATGKKLPDPEGDKRRKKREAAGKVRKSCRAGRKI